MNHDWEKIKTEYITTDISYRELAEKYGISLRTLGEQASKNKWVDLRKRHRDKIVTKVVRENERRQVRRYERIMSVTDKLLGRIEKAVEELDCHLATSTKKTKKLQYGEGTEAGRLVSEIIDEVEEIKEIRSIIDRSGIKQLTSALRDIKEVQMIRSEMDESEQEARIAKLRRDAEAKDDTPAEIKISFGGDDKWSQ